MYIEGSIRAYNDRLASAAPEPGGGSASALVGAVGAALVSMVASLTVNKKGYEDVQERIDELLEKSEGVRRRLQELVDEDTAVYGKLAAVFKMLRDTEEQKGERRKAMQAALKEATDVPYQIGEQCLEVAEISLTAGEIGNVRAVSDAGVAVLFAEAAAQGAALNVKINLGSIEDEDFNKKKWDGIQDILKRAGKMREEVLALTYEKLG